MSLAIKLTKKYLNDNTKKVVMSLSYKSNIPTILIICILLVQSNTTSIPDILTSVNNTTINEFAFLLAMHGYNVSYIDKVFYLDNNKLQDIMNGMRPKSTYSQSTYSSMVK